MANVLDSIVNYITTNHHEIINNADKDSETLLELDYTSFNNYLTENHNTTVFSSNFRQIFKAVNEKLLKTTGKRLCIKISDFPINHMIRNLDADYVGKFVTTTAMVRNISQINLSLVSAMYECRACGKYHEVRMTDEAVKTPSKCVSCGNKSFNLIQEASTYENYKYLRLEEPIELRIGGNTREFKAKLTGYLASPQYTIKAGDICDIAGELTVKYNEKKNRIEPFFDIWHIKPLNSAFEELKISEEECEQIKELSQSNIFEKLTQSIAPQVYGYDKIKEGLVLQMFEGDRNSADRHTIHILLMGDPGIGKSKLIESVYDVSPKSIKANGSGTSQAGITASAVRDEMTGSWNMEAGAIVLADGGLLTIDEFDKLNKDAMKGLNEPMEQLSCSVAKAGLVQTMSARTNVLAGANPKYSKFNEYKPIGEQINIPASTLSRFDLIYALEDKVDIDEDRVKAEKVLMEETIVNDVLDKNIIKKYVSYAKNNCFPQLSREAIDKISEFYSQTRALSIDYEDMGKPITLRELKAIQRLSVARAKVELRDIVTVKDTEEAIRIYQNSLETLGLNFNTVGAIQGVYSEQELKMIEMAEELITEEISMGSTEYSENIKNLIKTSFNSDEHIVEKMYNIAKENVVIK